MLKELKTYHEELLAFIAELERLSQEASPRMDAIANVRFKLTRVSRRRTSFLERSVYPQILPGAKDPERSRFAALRNEEQASRMNSTDHIAHWTPAMIEHDWAGYRTASDKMRRSMRTRIRQEQEAFYPLLEAIDGSQIG